MIIVGLAFLGLSLGSFVNALVWRLRQQSLASPKSSSKKLSTSKNRVAIFTGRSMCPKCHHQLAVKDLIPVMSWLSLGGKCRYCQKPISWHYPLTEILTAVFIVFSYLYWPNSFNSSQMILFGLWTVFITGFIALALYDLKWYLLPNNIIYLLLALAIAQSIWLALEGGSLNPLQSSFFGMLVGGGIFYVLFQLSRGKWIGGGDVKLGALSGIIVGGPINGLLMLFVASCLGTLVSIPLVLSGKANRKTRLPFGPFLILATVIVRLFGASLIAWYKRNLLLP